MYESRVLPNRGGGGRRISGAFGDALTAGHGGGGRGDVLLVPIDGR
jgi:hypothetical protein